MSEPRPWHRLFGLAWADFCEGSALEVNPEVDLSVQQQFLDLLLRRQAGALPQPLPDGFDNLDEYNVLTFKSHQEALDRFALCELISHYTTARKRYSTSLKQMLPETAFRLYAVCVRFPRDLAQHVTLTLLQPGVYELELGIVYVRVIVVQQLRQEQHNALLQLFSTQVEQLRHARQTYKARTTDMTTLFYDLLKMSTEDPEMSELLKEYAREALKELLKDVPPEKRMEGIPAEKRMEGIPAEKRMEGLSAEQVVEALPPEALWAALEAVQRRLQANGPSKKPQGPAPASGGVAT